MSGYIEWRKNANIKEVIVPNKEKYYMDILNIEHSWSGRMDTNIGNTFIMEATQQIVNAIELFEQGYFDCAYYSLRSAVDLSTTMAFLVDMPETERSTYLTAWKDTADFPMQSQMIKKLTDDGDVFSDMRSKIPEFFADAKELSKKLNKYVHKQGLQHFYVSRNHPLNLQKDCAKFIAEFEYYIKSCIGVVAVMRLVFDPFPVLLMDEEILYRCFDSITDPYTENFIDEYIGSEIIEKYKQTKTYLNVYDSFIHKEKKNDAVFNVMKYCYIETKQIEKILSQLYLLNRESAICVLMVAACDEIVKVYCYNGFMMFTTDRETNQKQTAWSGCDFKKFEEADNLINQEYGEGYISAFHFEGNTYYVEHNRELNFDTIRGITDWVSVTLKKLEAGEEKGI